MDKGECIDTARDWLDQLKASYLAKEDLIVYYGSLTGKKVDRVWIKLTLREVVRIIKATLLSVDDQKDFKVDHIVAAAQELGVVYHFGTKSRHKTSSHIFNYLHEAADKPERILMNLIVDEMCAEGKLAFLVEDIDSIFASLVSKLHYKTPVAKDKNLAMIEMFNIAGYSVKIGSERVNMPDKSKKRAILKLGYKPTDIERLSIGFKQSVIKRLFNILK